MFHSIIRHVLKKTPYAFCGIFLLIAFTDAAITPHFDPLARFVAMSVLSLAFLASLLGKPVNRALFLAGAAVYVIQLVFDWSASANHAFLIVYYAVFFALVTPSDAQFWRHGTFFSMSMLALLMGFALLQKLTSPYFLSGNLIASLVLQGEVYLSILSALDPGVPDTIAASVRQMSDFGSDHQVQFAGGSADLPDLGPILLVAIYGMTFAALLLQGVLEVAILFHKRFGIWLHRLIFLFTLVVYTMRPENVFLSLNMMMGYALTDEQSQRMRLPYVIAILYFLSTALIGFRPDIIG